jgi:hypothetical protein
VSAPIPSVRLVAGEDVAASGADPSVTHVPNQGRRDPTNRRAHRRLTAGDLAWLRSTRIKYGAAVRLIDLSAGGMAIETSDALRPDSTMVFELTGCDGGVLVSARVLRCEKVGINAGPRYRSACVFKRPLDLSRIVTVPAQPDAPRAAVSSEASTATSHSTATLSTSWQKVVVRYRDGRVLRGYTCDFSVSRPQLHVSPNPASADALFVPLNQLKAVFFVRDFEGDPSYTEQKTFSARTEGRRLEVTFEDGEVLVGSTLSYRHDSYGFVVHPADKKANNLRVFVASSAVRHVRFLPRP